MIGGKRQHRQYWLQAEDSKKEEGSLDAVVEPTQNQLPDESGGPGDFSIDMSSDVQVIQNQSVSDDQNTLVPDLPPLEVGTPGDFNSAILEHNEKSELAIGSEQSSSAGSPDFLTMIDEPMPESIGGGSAEVQSMFVEEVLRAAKASESETMADQPSLSEVEFGPKPDTSNELTLTTAVSSLALNGELEQPDSPRVSELREKKAPTPPPTSGQEESTKVVQGSTKISVSEAGNSGSSSHDEKTKIADKVDGEKSTSGKSSGKKEKSTKKGSPASKKSTETKSQQSEQNAVAPLSQTEVTVQQPDKRRKELRFALGVLVSCVALAASIIFVKKYSVVEKSEPALPMAESVKKDEPSIAAVIDLEKGVITPSADENNLPLKNTSGKEDKSVVSQEIQGPPNSKVLNAKSGNAPSSVEPTSNEGEEDNPEDHTLVLTRPNSRYSEINPALRPLIDLVIALDKVQPRKALNQLKQLPESFASTNGTERSALREVTARYYLQVGAPAKAVKLFREVCLDPNGSSEIEMCLHAARGFVVTGQFEEAETLLDSLKIRATRDRSIWLEWVKVLEAAQALVQPSTERFTDFIDEFAEKAPYMTSEWNLQLSTFFARKFSGLSRSEQLDILKMFDKRRRKTLEVRLAPLRYGSDVGSYMLPSFLNIFFKFYELPELIIDGEDPQADSQASLVSWTFFVVSQSKATELRQTRARLAPLFAERAFAPLARVIEAHLAAQAGDFLGASALMSEQVSLQPALQVVLDSKEVREKNAASNFLKATQRFEQMPFLFVEWLYLGVKVAAGLNDLNFMATVLTALEGVSARFPEVQSDFQYWNILARGYKVLGKVADLRTAVKKAESVASTKHELGFVTGYKVWLLMKSRKVQQARILMREGLRLYPHHARLLEFGAEFAAQWGEDPAYYLGLESDVPRQFQNRGRDRTLLSLFTVSKLLNKF